MTFSNDERPKVLIALNTAWNLYNFRANLIRALVAAGYDVVATAPPDAYADRLPALGCRFVPLPMASHGTALISELALCLRFWRLLRAEQPQAYLGYTVKPNTYGSLLAGLRGVAVVNNISGLGTAFLRGGWLGWVVGRWYALGLRRSARVFFGTPKTATCLWPAVWCAPGRPGCCRARGWTCSVLRRRSRWRATRREPATRCVFCWWPACCATRG